MTETDIFNELKRYIEVQLANANWGYSSKEQAMAYFHNAYGAFIFTTMNFLHGVNYNEMYDWWDLYRDRFERVISSK